MERTILVSQHVPVENPGTIATSLRRHGYELRTVRTWLGEPVPRDPDGVAAVVVMGGPMGVYQADRHPHLTDEIALLRGCLERGVPVLGVCLGSQLLAVAAGGRVYPSGIQEIGWYEVRSTAAGRDDPLWREAPDPMTVLEWHGDYYDLPEGAVALAGSARFPAQAFRVGDRAYGLLFHIETPEEMVDDWLAYFAADVAAVEPPIEVEAIRRQARERCEEMRPIAERVFDRFGAGIAAWAR